MPRMLVRETAQLVREWLGFRSKPPEPQSCPLPAVTQCAHTAERAEYFLGGRTGAEEPTNVALPPLPRPSSGATGPESRVGRPLALGTSPVIQPQKEASFAPMPCTQVTL